MSEFSEIPLLAAPGATDPAQDGAGDDPDGAAPEGGGASGEGRRAADTMPEAAANNYRFAGLVTLIPEDPASVDRLA